MDKNKICPICGHKNVTIEDSQEGFDWYKITCKDCFTFIIHESVFMQLADLEKDKEKNKRKRLNCVYNFLLKNPRYNRYYYKFFYEDETKFLSTNDPVKINIASRMDTLPTKTKDKMSLVLKNLLEKYNLGKDIETEELDLGLMLIEEENEMQSILKYFYDRGVIDPIISAGEIIRFRLTINAKIYLEEGDSMNMENSKNTTITNITNTTDNSIYINEVKNIKKSNIGQNKTKSDKEIKVETNVETNIVKENKKGLFSWFKSKRRKG